MPTFLKNQEQNNEPSVQQVSVQENQWKQVGRQQTERFESNVNNYATQLQQEAPSRFGRAINRNVTTIAPTNTPTNEYKDERVVSNDVSGNVSRFASSGTIKNKFETLSEDYVPQPVKNLQPSKAPRLGDSEAEAGAGTSSKSFSSKFSEKQGSKSLGVPSFIKIPKTESFEEFPSLGITPKKTPSASSQLNELDTPKSTSSFANLAKGWAKKSEEEEFTSKQEKQRSEKQRIEEEAFRNNVYLFGGKLSRTRQEEDEDEFGDSLDDEERRSDALDDGEDFEIPSGEEDLGEPSEDDDDYNDHNGETPVYEERF